MQNRFYILFVDLIKVSLGKKQFLPTKPTIEEWQLLYEECKRQTLVGITYEGVQRLPLEQRPPKNILFLWYVNKEAIVRQNLKLNKRTIETALFFSRKGYKNCILKGQGIALYYPNPLLRTSGDIDIWVDEERTKILEYVRQKEVLQGVTYSHVHFSLFSDVLVEVHFTPSWVSSPRENRILQSIFQNVWQEDLLIAQKLPGADGVIQVPNYVINCFYLIVHIFRHVWGEGIGLRQLMDLHFLLLSKHTQEDNEHIIKLLDSCGLTKFTASLMYVLKSVFFLEDSCLLVPLEIKGGKFLLREIFQSGNFGKYDQRINRHYYRFRFFRFFFSIKRNVRFWQLSRREFFWDPLFKIWHFCWRKYHGWM